MPADAGFKIMNAVHRLVLKATGGQMGWTAMDMPVVELTTTGRKSGQSRSVFLTSPLQEGPVLVVVASRGGDDRAPAWFLNVRDNPDVEVRVQGKPPQRMRGRVATPAERKRLWPLVTADHKNYAGYQTKTTREIPLVLLEPLD
jgi:deazaflavin-dependent oxidoreductase (nitroreductase family)